MRHIALLLILSVGTLALPSTNQAQDAADVHPVVAEVTQQLGKRPATRPFLMMVTLNAKKGKGQMVVDAMAEATPPTRKEEANVRYQLVRDPKSPTTLLIIEQWKSVEGLAKHLKQDYIVKLLTTLDETLAEPPAIKVYAPINFGRGKKTTPAN